jgi:conserved oligomeric Golgi complex subunit 8
MAAATGTAAAIGNANGDAPPASSSPFDASAAATATTTTALSQRQVNAYMSELLSFSLERLQSEPRVLAEEAARLERHAQQAAVFNHRAFIDGSDALQAAQGSLRQSITRLDDLLADGPVAGLSGACEQFAQTAARTIAAGKANKALLASQPALLDLLEAPSLAELCVRGGAYDEALELAAFASRLALLHPELPVARALKRRMDDVSAQMLASLLGRLRSSSLTLPECLRLVGYLRRVPQQRGGAAGAGGASAASSSPWGAGGGGGLDEEAGLRLQFLRCRDEWLAGLVRDLEAEMTTTVAAGGGGGAGAGAGAGAGGAGSAAGGATAASAAAASSVAAHEPYGGRAAEYVKRLIDLHRLHLFDIVMQYRAVFSDGVLSAGGAGGAGAGLTGGAATATTSPSASAPAAAAAAAVLPSWLTYRVGEFADSLAAALPHVTDGASLASTMEHCAYAGASLGRVGADYTAQLAAVFEACSLRLFAAYLGAAGDAFRARLESHRWIALAGSRSSAAARAAAAAAAAGASASDGGGGGGAGAGGEASGAASSSAGLVVPPAALMEHPPVAVFVNGVLAALNELRHCATWSSRGPCGKALQGSLDGAALAMVSFSHSHPLPDGELQQFRAAARMLGDVAAPFLIGCFARVFSASATADQVGAGAGGSRMADQPEVRSIKAVLQEVLEM